MTGTHLTDKILVSALADFFAGTSYMHHSIQWNLLKIHKYSREFISRFALKDIFVRLKLHNIIQVSETAVDIDSLAVIGYILNDFKNAPLALMLIYVETVIFSLGEK